MTDPPGAIRVMRVIARLNMGGPSIHVSLLGDLHSRGYETLLAYGSVGSREGSLANLAEQPGIKRLFIPWLGPELRVARDLRALGTLVRAGRRFRPHIVHTHTAKAGMLGRAAALLLRPRPVVVHTYHGHVLEGYFGPFETRVYRTLERLLARISDRLIGVSAATVDDLVRLGVASRAKFEIIPLGLRLERFGTSHPSAASLRRELAVEPGEVLLTFVGRLVPIKRVDTALRGLAHARELGASARLAIVGDGELRQDLEALTATLGLSDVVRFLGHREDMPLIAAATDIAVLTSANEGTPVWLIEAAAAGCPSIATRVGGVADVVRPDSGITVPADDEEALARAIVDLSGDHAARERMGQQARAHVLSRFGAERLLADVDSLYRKLLG